MRLFVFLTASLILSAPLLRAEEPVAPAPAAAVEDPADPFHGVPVPLAEALRNYAKDAPRWAYTQRLSQYDRKGKPTETWVARHDPSQHYDVQWTLLERDGKAPTEKQQKKFRADRLEQERKGRKALGELLVLPQAVLLADQTDSPDALVYEVPLKRSEDMRLPPEKFLVQVKITRDTHRLQSIDVLLRAKIRLVGVFSLKAGEAHIRFADVTPEFGPAVSQVSASGSGSVFFVPVGGKTELVRSDFKHVKPYDERFEVKFGPLRTIDF